MFSRGKGIRLGEGGRLLLTFSCLASSSIQQHQHHWRSFQDCAETRQVQEEPIESSSSRVLDGFSREIDSFQSTGAVAFEVSKRERGGALVRMVDGEW